MQLSLHILILLTITSLLVSNYVIKGSKWKVRIINEQLLSIITNKKENSKGKDENQSISTSGILKSPESTNDKYMMTTSSHFILNMSNPSWYEDYQTYRNNIWTNSKTLESRQKEFLPNHVNNNLEEYIRDIKDHTHIMRYDKWKQKASSLALISPFPDNVYLVQIKNFCYNSKNNHVYVSDTKDLELFKQDYIYVGPTFEIVLNNNIIQDEVVVIDLENVYIPIGTFKRHITHFIEVYNFFLHYIHNPDLYPIMKNIIAPSLILSYEYPWIHSYLNILLNNFPPQLDISLYPDDILQKSKITFFCMNDAIFVGKTSYNHMNGVNFVQHDDTYYIRVMTYKACGMNMQLRRVISTDDLVIKFYSRENGKYTINHNRVIINMDEINHLFKLYSVNVTYVNIEKLGFVDQVKLFVDSDILIMVAGGALTNAIFMLPNSGVVSINSPFSYSNRYLDLCVFSNVHYLPLQSEQYADFSNPCFNNETYSEYPTVQFSKGCYETFYHTKILRIEKYNLLASVEQMKETVFITKYSYYTSKR